MFFASWQSIIETGGKVQVSLGSQSRVMEDKSKNWMFDKAKQVPIANFVPFSRHKTGSSEKGKPLSVLVKIFPLLTFDHESWVMTKSAIINESVRNGIFAKNQRSYNVWKNS